MSHDVEHTELVERTQRTQQDREVDENIDSGWKVITEQAHDSSRTVRAFS